MTRRRLFCTTTRGVFVRRHGRSVDTWLLHDPLPQPRRAFVEDGQKLNSQFVQHFQRHGFVHIPKPVFTLAALRDLEYGGGERGVLVKREECLTRMLFKPNYLEAEPFAHEMDANTGHHSGLVLEAHGGQVQTATT